MKSASPYGSERVPSAYARALLGRFAPSAQARAELFSLAGIDKAALDDARAELSLASMLALVEAVTARHGESWPLDARLLWSAAMQGALDVAVRTAPALGRSLEILARYGAVRAPYIALRLRRTKTYTEQIIVAAAPMSDAAWRATAIGVMLGIDAMLSQVGGDAMRRACVFLPWPAPDYVDRLRAMSPCRFEFGAKTLAFRVPAEVCALASPFADPDLCASALRELEESVADVAENSVSKKIRRLIRRSLPRRLTEEEAAHAVGASRRSLVRKLSAAGCTYRELRDAVLAEEAATMLRDGSMSRDAMAAALGYADPTSFSRACRRWFKT